MSRKIIFVYGVVCYAMFFASFLYLIGFLSNFVVPKSIDSGEVGSLGMAIAINLGLLAIFGIQHSVMARPAFKRAITKSIPEPAERATYVLLSSFVLFALYGLWRPMEGVVWDIQNSTGRGIVWALFGLGWGVVLGSTLLLNHFDLFGLRQVWIHLMGREYTPVKMAEPGPYKIVRHPLYVGWLMTFWITPTMSHAHLLFATGMLVYILIAIHYEERDLVQAFGADYEEYRRRTPMLIPNPFRKA